LQPLIFIAAYVFVCISIIFNTPKIALTGTAVLAGFMILYFLTVGRNKIAKSE